MASDLEDFADSLLIEGRVYNENDQQLFRERTGTASGEEVEEVKTEVNDLGDAVDDATNQISEISPRVIELEEEVQDINNNSLPSKSNISLTNTQSGAVLNRHYAPESISIDKLEPGLLDAIASQLDPDLYQGEWDASTNTPVIPAAAGNTGKHYYVNVAGTATGNAAGTYIVGDKIRSDGTVWVHIHAPATNIPDDSIDPQKNKGTIVQVDPFLIEIDGESHEIVWCLYAKNSGGQKRLQFGLTKSNLLIPDPTAGARFVKTNKYISVNGELKKALYYIANAAGTSGDLVLDEDGNLHIRSVVAVETRVSNLETWKVTTDTRLTQAESDIVALQEGGSTEGLSERMDELETAQLALDERTDDLESFQIAIDDRVDDIETSLPNKASIDLTNVTPSSVTESHLTNGIVSYNKLSPSVISMLLGGVDPAKFVGEWIPATNTPAVPVAAPGNNGNWYFINQAGTATTGNAMGTYGAADKIVSNGTSWVRQAASPTYIPDHSIPPEKLQYQIIGEHWITYKGKPVKLAWSIANSSGTVICIGGDENGQLYAPTLGLPGYVAPDYILVPKAGGGIYRMERDDPDAPLTELIGGEAEWSDFQNVKGDAWVARSDADLIAGPGMYRINGVTGRFLPLDQSVLLGFGAAGQSVAQGQLSTPLCSTIPRHPGFSWMFNVGARAGASNGGSTPILLDGSTITSFVDYVETVNATMNESPWSGCLNSFHQDSLEELNGRVHTHLSNHALGAGSYTAIEQGTIPYTNGITEMTKAVSLAAAIGKTYIYGATLMVHGESNEGGRTPASTYAAYMQDYATDIALDAKTITGQTWDPPLIISQCSSWCNYGFQTPTASLGQLAVALVDPRIILACPKYFLEYVDNVHLKGPDSRRLGEYYAKVLEWLMKGKIWLPLYMKSAIQDASNVIATFHVPVGNLAFDTTIVTNPGNYGFELAGATISGTPIISGDTVIIPKTGTATAVRYAYTSFGTTPGVPSKAGRATGPRGNLRDTDPRISKFDGYPLFNWCCTSSIDL